jgi:hypothetical protein
MKDTAENKTTNHHLCIVQGAASHWGCQQGAESACQKSQQAYHVHAMKTW